VPLASPQRWLAVPWAGRYPAMPKAGLAGRRGLIFIAKCQWFLNVQAQHAPSGCSEGRGDERDSGWIDFRQLPHGQQPAA